MVVLLVAAAVVAGAPLVAALLVSVASLREEAGHSLARRPGNWIEAAARRLLAFEPGYRRPRQAAGGRESRQLARR
jgi:hypothetical protein